jgi:uncharacterized protein YacL
MKSLILFFCNLFVFMVLNFMDAHSTYLVIRNSNLKSERNPFARYIFNKIGIIRGMVILKLISFSLIPLMIFAYTESPKSINYLLIFINFLYSIVVSNNYKIFKKIT